MRVTKTQCLFRIEREQIGLKRIKRQDRQTDGHTVQRERGREKKRSGFGQNESLKALGTRMSGELEQHGT